MAIAAALFTLVLLPPPAPDQSAAAATMAPRHRIYDIAVDRPLPPLPLPVLAVPMPVSVIRAQPAQTMPRRAAPGPLIAGLLPGEIALASEAWPAEAAIAPAAGMAPRLLRLTAEDLSVLIPPTLSVPHPSISPMPPKSLSTPQVDTGRLPHAAPEIARAAPPSVTSVVKPPPIRLPPAAKVSPRATPATLKRPPVPPRRQTMVPTVTKPAAASAPSPVARSASPTKKGVGLPRPVRVPRSEADIPGTPAWATPRY